MYLYIIKALNKIKNKQDIGGVYVPFTRLPNYHYIMKYHVPGTLLLYFVPILFKYIYFVYNCV